MKLFRFIVFALAASLWASESQKADILKDENKYIVLQISRLGLGNRLRSIADWYQIAVISERHLLVSWVPTADCKL